MNIRTILLLLAASMLAISCSDDDDSTDPVSLVADAGPSQQVKPFELVTLDGTGSTGPSGFTYEWTYVGDVPEEEINFQGKNTSQPTFVPPLGDIYTFILKVTSGSDTDEDDVVISASGAVEIGGTLTEDMELENLEPNSSLPDYIVTTQLTVENGIKLSIIEKDVRIKFNEGTGIVIQTNGVFTNLDESSGAGFESDLYGDNGWIGIQLKDGILELDNLEINGAGKSTFYGIDEPAALTINNRNAIINEFSNINFVGSLSYDINVLTNPRSSERLRNTRLSYTIPIKAPITFMDYWHYDEPFIFPDMYDYIELTPGGGDNRDEINSYFVFHAGGKYYIDGDFWAGKSIEIMTNSTIYMKENSAIYTEGNFVINTAPNNEVLIEGLNGANWKGIAAAPDREMRINDATIRNAGHGIIKVGDFEAKVPAALYTPNPGSTTSYVGYMDFSEIINSGGYGYYSESIKRVGFNIRGTLFKNTEFAAIRTTTVCVASTAIGTNFPNTFELAPGIPPYLVEENGSPGDVWYELGGDNYYLIDADMDLDNGFTLGPGCILKFKSGRSLICDNPNSTLRFESFTDDSIILEGENDAPGSWGGLYLGCDFRIIDVIIRNGGEFILPGATEKANIVSAVPESLTGQLYMTQSHIANSAGYGIVIESGTKDIEYENPELENSFNNNVLGDIYRK